MKKQKTLSSLFLVIGLIVSHIMCAHVAFAYCTMQWGIKYEGYSAPANTAFLIAIPYLLVAAGTFGLSRVFCKRSRRCVNGE